MGQRARAASRGRDREREEGDGDERRPDQGQNEDQDALPKVYGRTAAWVTSPVRERERAVVPRRPGLGAPQLDIGGLESRPQRSNPTSSTSSLARFLALATSESFIGSGFSVPKDAMSGFTVAFARTGYS